MSTVPYFQFYPADYLADTRHLSTEQHGAYLLLLMTAWSRGGRLPNDPKKLSRIIGSTVKKWHQIWEDISEFWVLDGDEIVSERMQKDFQKAVSKSESRATAGKLGGKAKALKNKEPPLANGEAKTGDLLCHLPEPEPEPPLIPPPGGDARAKNSRGSRLSPEWQLPQAWGEWARGEGLSDSVIRNEASKFKDHWLSSPGAKGRKCDWQATWRNWCRRVIEDSRRSPARAQQGSADGFLRTVQQRHGLPQ